jgi:hypothetical protein
MGMVTLAHFNLCFSIETKEEATIKTIIPNGPWYHPA